MVGYLVGLHDERSLGSLEGLHDGPVGRLDGTDAGFLVGFLDGLKDQDGR
jgi:hypothetical protein